VNGRVSIATRALERTVAAVAAERMGVPIKDVTIRLSDDSGLLSVAVTGPLAVRPLRSPLGSGGLRTRVDALREGIRTDVSSIAGSTVSRVAVEVSRAIIIDERRVL
jgi:hypothetical protein